MTARTRNAFTLVELLVVIVIISMLVALLLPAVNAARARAKQAKCSNNQKELALAVLQYEAKKGQLPGYTNSHGAVALDPGDKRKGLSWTLMLLPYIGRNDVWQAIQSWDINNEAKVLNDMPGKIPEFVCPSDESEERFALSYAANCGKFTPGNNMDPLYGLFTKQCPITKDNRVLVRTERIRDGASNTILFSENLQSTQWLPLDGPVAVSRRAGSPYVVDVGIMWSDGTATCDPELDDQQPAARINECRDDNPEFPWSSAETDADVLSYRHYARPSSNHPGGVIVTYADGHQDFLAEDIDALVYHDQLDPAGNGTRQGPQ